MNNKQTCGADMNTVIDHSKILACIPQMQQDMRILREKLIDGNGKDGLLTRHEVLETKFAELESNAVNRDENRKWLIALIVSVLLSLASNSIVLYFNSNFDKSVKKEATIIEQVVSDKQVADTKL